MAQGKEIEKLADELLENLSTIGVNETEKAFIIMQAFKQLDEEKLPKFIAEAM